MARQKGGWIEVRSRDRQLVAGCLRNDEDAWTEVWALYGPLVKSVALRNGCDSEEAREVLQRVGLVAIQGLGRLKDAAKLGGWLAGVARFQALEVLRQRRPGGELFEDTAVVDPAHDDRLARDQQLAHLHGALLELPDRCRMIITRLDLRDPPDSYAEVALEHGLASSSIGPIRRRCLENLRKILETVSPSR